MQRESLPLARRRLAFGDVAALYDRARPPFPDAALDALIAGAGLTPGAHVLEVGAGTGKATAALAARGLRITALEPSAEMAELARHNCAGFNDAVEVVEIEFERFAARGPYAAVICANAWHWIDPATRYRRAHDALAPGGFLAALWLFPDWSGCALREALAEVYRATVPELAPEFPMHPESDPTRLAGDWRSETLRSDLFVAPEVVTIASQLVLTADAYVDLLCTHQDHILLTSQRRDRLLTRVAATIERSGATIVLPTIAYACVARRD